MICFSSVNEYSKTNRPSKQVYCSKDYVFLMDLTTTSATSTTTNELSSSQTIHLCKVSLRHLHIIFNCVSLLKLCASCFTKIFLCRIAKEIFLHFCILTLNFKETDNYQYCSVSSYSQRIVFLPKDCASIRFCCDRRPYARFSHFVISFFSEALTIGNMVLLSLNDCWLFYTDLNPHHFLTVKTTTCSKITKLNLETF